MSIVYVSAVSALAGFLTAPTIARYSMTNVFACWALLHTWCLIYACISVACMRNDKCCARSWSGAGLHSASSGRSLEIYILYAEHCHVHRLCFHLCYECGIWSMLSANGLMATCIRPWADTAWNLYFLYAEHCHVHGIWSVRSVVLYMKKKQCCVCWWSGAKIAFDIAWIQQGTCILFVYWNFALSIGYDQCWVCWWSDA